MKMRIGDEDKDVVEVGDKNDVLSRSELGDLKPFKPTGASIGTHFGELDAKSPVYSPAKPTAFVPRRTPTDISDLVSQMCIKN